MVIVGAASGMTDVLMNARVSELEELYKRPLMNANHAMFSVGYAVSAVASGFAREAQIAPGMAFSYVALTIFLLSAFLYMPVRDSSKASGERGGYPFWPIVLCGLIVLVAFMTEATVETWSALHIERTLGGRAAEGAMGPAMLGITMAVGRFSGQAVSQMFSDTKVIIVATLVAATGAVFAALAPTPLWAYVGFGILGLGVSVIGPLGLALVGKVCPQSSAHRSYFAGRGDGIFRLFLSAHADGMVSEFHGLRVAFLCAAALSLMVIR